MAKVQPSDARGVRRRNGEGGKFNVSTICFSFDLNSMNFFGMLFMYLVRYCYSVQKLIKSIA